MPGGLLNIVSEGNNNVILNGNPTKTFFNVTYSKYTNFGLQKFRLDYEGTRDLRTSTPSQFKFKVKRYAELLMDTYVVVNLPDIWSPIHEPTSSTSNKWVPYDFKWIKNIGTQGRLHQSKANQVGNSMYILKFGKKESLKLLDKIYYSNNIPYLSRKRLIYTNFINN